MNIIIVIALFLIYEIISCIEIRKLRKKVEEIENTIKNMTT